jgi:hypothetical protein
LNEAFTVRPFGDPVQIGRPSDPRSASGDLAQWLDELAERINQRNCDRTAALAALRELCRLPSQRPADYDSARQIAWAFRTLYQELDPPPPAAAEVQAALTVLGEELQLQLPARPEDVEPRGESDARGRFDPERFRERMEVLGKALGE